MAFVSFLEYYVEYVCSLTVLLIILVILGPLYLEIFKDKRPTALHGAASIPGCFPLGHSKRSNLDDQYSRSTSQNSGVDQTAHIKALFTYPVKSCRGVELAASEVGPTGLKYDRLFTFAQLVSTPEKSKADPVSGAEEVSKDWNHQWRFITQREFPRLASIETELWIPYPKTSKRAERPAIASDGTNNTVNGRRRRKKSPDESAGSKFLSIRRPSQSSEEQLGHSWVRNGGCLVLRFPFEPDLNFLGLRREAVTIRLPLIPTEQRTAEKNYKTEPVSIWKDTLRAINVTGEICSSDLAKLKYFLGVSNPLGLFLADQINRRAVTRSLPKDRPNENYTVGFADAFPFHVLNLASVRAQDAELPAKSPLKGSLDARRFRANVYISGLHAYDEDSWKRVTIGRCIKPRHYAYINGGTNSDQTRTQGQGHTVETDGEYHVACRTARCKLPNVDQGSGVKDTNEPFATLSRTRKVDKGAYPHPCLGMQMIPLFQQGILRVGDKVKVLERGEHVYEKMFA